MIDWSNLEIGDKYTLPLIVIILLFAGAGAVTSVMGLLVLAGVLISNYILIAPSVFILVLSFFSILYITFFRKEK